MTEPSSSATAAEPLNSADTDNPQTPQPKKTANRIPNTPGSGSKFDVAISSVEIEVDVQDIKDESFKTYELKDVASGVDYAEVILGVAYIDLREVSHDWNDDPAGPPGRGAGDLQRSRVEANIANLRDSYTSSCIRRTQPPDYLVATMLPEDWEEVIKYTAQVTKKGTEETRAALSWRDQRIYNSRVDVPVAYFPPDRKFKIVIQRGQHRTIALVQNGEAWLQAQKADNPKFTARWHGGDEEETEAARNRFGWTVAVTDLRNASEDIITTIRTNKRDAYEPNSQGDEFRLGYNCFMRETEARRKEIMQYPSAFIAKYFGADFTKEKKKYIMKGIASAPMNQVFDKFTIYRFGREYYDHYLAAQLPRYDCGTIAATWFLSKVNKTGQLFRWSEAKSKPMNNRYAATAKDIAWINATLKTTRKDGNVKVARDDPILLNLFFPTINAPEISVPGPANPNVPSYANDLPGWSKNVALPENDIHEDLWAKIGEPADLAGRNYFRPGFLYSFTPEERVNIYHRLRSKGPYGKEHLLSREAVGEFVRTLLPWTGVALRLWHCAFFPNATFAWNEPNKKTATVNVDWLIEMGKAMYPDLPDEEYDPEDETYVAKAEKIEENRMKFKQWVMGPVLSMITDKIKTWKLRGQEAWGHVKPDILIRYRDPPKKVISHAKEMLGQQYTRDILKIFADKYPKFAEVDEDNESFFQRAIKMEGYFTAPLHTNEAVGRARDFTSKFVKGLENLDDNTKGVILSHNKSIAGETYAFIMSRIGHYLQTDLVEDDQAMRQASMSGTVVQAKLRNKWHGDVKKMSKADRAAKKLQFTSDEDYEAASESLGVVTDTLNEMGLTDENHGLRQDTWTMFSHYNHQNDFSKVVQGIVDPKISSAIGNQDSGLLASIEEFKWDGRHLAAASDEMKTRAKAEQDSHATATKSTRTKRTADEDGDGENQGRRKRNKKAPKSSERVSADDDGTPVANPNEAGSNTMTDPLWRVEAGLDTYEDDRPSDAEFAEITKELREYVIKNGGTWKDDTADAFESLIVTAMSSLANNDKSSYTWSSAAAVVRRILEQWKNPKTQHKFGEHVRQFGGATKKEPLGKALFAYPMQAVYNNYVLANKRLAFLQGPGHTHLMPAEDDWRLLAIWNEWKDEEGKQEGDD